MDRRPLGKTNLHLSILGLGTVKFGRNTGVKYPQPFNLPTDQQINNLLNLARDLGINFVDTAPAYGSSEKRLGELLPYSPTSEWIISTKVGESFHNGKSEFNFSAKYTKHSVHQSLKNLKRQSLDLVLIHSDGIDETESKFAETFQALADLKSNGLIRAFGMSPKTAPGAQFALQHADALMLTLNHTDTAMLPVIEEANRENVGVIIKKGFAGGHLNKVRTENTSGNEASTLDPAENALRFILQTPGVASLVIGTINPKHLRRNAELLNQIFPNH